jgi:hypothetical protein
MEIEELTKVIKALPDNLCRELTEKLEVEHKEDNSSPDTKVVQRTQLNELQQKYLKVPLPKEENAERPSPGEIRDLVENLIERTLTE